MCQCPPCSHATIARASHPGPSRSSTRRVSSAAASCRHLICSCLRPALASPCTGSMSLHPRTRSRFRSTAIAGDDRAALLLTILICDTFASIALHQTKKVVSNYPFNQPRPPMLCLCTRCASPTADHARCVVPCRRGDGAALAARAAQLRGLRRIREEMRIGCRCAQCRQLRARLSLRRARGCVGDGAHPALWHVRPHGDTPVSPHNIGSYVHCILHPDIASFALAIPSPVATIGHTYSEEPHSARPPPRGRRRRQCALAFQPLSQLSDICTLRTALCPDRYHLLYRSRIFRSSPSLSVAAWWHSSPQPI